MARKYKIARKAREAADQMVKKEVAKREEKKRDYETKLRLAKAAREARLQAEKAYIKPAFRAFSAPFRHLKVQY